MQQAQILPELGWQKIAIQENALPSLLIEYIDHRRVIHRTLAHHRGPRRNPCHIVSCPDRRQLLVRSQQIMPALISLELVFL